MKCELCGTSKERLIKSRQFNQTLCSKCYQRERYSRSRFEIPPKGVKYVTEDDKYVCHICGKAYKKLAQHAYNSHGMNEKEYKEKFGLDRKGIVAKSTRDLLRKSVKDNYKLVVGENLIKGGADNRFKDGGEGRKAEKCRLETLKRLKGEDTVLEISKV